MFSPACLYDFSNQYHRLVVTKVLGPKVWKVSRFHVFHLIKLLQSAPPVGVDLMLKNTRRSDVHTVRTIDFKIHMNPRNENNHRQTISAI